MSGSKQLTDSLNSTVYDADYRSSLKDWNSFVESLTEELTKIDDTVPELPLKDVVSIDHRYEHSHRTNTYLDEQVFRIYRDIRFSKDPTPYKVCTSKAFGRNTNMQATASKWPLLSTATLRRMLTH